MKRLRRSKKTPLQRLVLRLSRELSQQLQAFLGALCSDSPSVMEFGELSIDSHLFVYARSAHQSMSRQVEEDRFNVLKDCDKFCSVISLSA
jgi:hypothetical protein